MRHDLTTCRHLRAIEIEAFMPQSRRAGHRAWETLHYFGGRIAPIVCAVALFMFACLAPLRATTTWSRLAVGNLIVFSMLASRLFIGAESYCRFFCAATDSLRRRTSANAGTTGMLQRGASRASHSSLLHSLRATAY